MATAPAFKVDDICVCRHTAEEEYEAKILGVREKAGRNEYLIQFKGWHVRYNQWKPETDILFKGTFEEYIKSEQAKLLDKKPEPEPEQEEDSPFPLFRLPFVASAHILKMMKVDKILLLSLASKRVNSQIKFLHLQVPDISIEVERGARIYNKSCVNELFSWSFNVEIFEAEKEWLAHFFEVYREAKVNELLFLQEIENFSDFKQVNNNLKELIFARPVKLAFCKKVLKVFTLARKIVLLDEADYSLRLCQFLVADFNYASFGQNSSLFPSDLRLENFLASNSKCIQTRKYSLTSEKQLNKFLKSWINGTVDRNLRAFQSIPRRNEYHAHVILDGVPHKTAPADRRKEFETVNGIFPVIGGFDIVAKDGTNATIKIGIPILNDFHFFVWN